MSPAPSDASWQPPYPESAPVPPVPAAQARAAVRDPIHQKIPFLAALLSGFPGMGNIYNGLYLRGLIQFLIVATLMNIMDHAENPFVGMSLAFFWVFGILDAYRQAALINFGYTQDLGLLDTPQRPRAGQGGLVAGVILMALGIVTFLDQYFRIDLRWLYDLWPLTIVAVGAWLVVASIKDRQKATRIED
ncbi:MAG: DUF5668 domain-containing protein [Acidobacteriota bacterium]